MSDEPLNNWGTVDTDGNGRLITLNLRGNRLNGEIPPELGNLSNLIQLYIYHNKLSGEIPPELGNFTSLENLQLHNNELSGCVPGNLKAHQLSARSNLGDLPPC